MRKTISFFLLLIIIISLSSCGKTENKPTSKSSDKDEAVSYAQEETVKIDYDISALSSTMAYSQIADMNNNYKNYLGKRIKMTGTFDVQETELRNYYTCNINDATACCAVWLEFVLKDELKYPDEYPPIGSKITVEGILNSYNEGENVFVELKDAEIIK